MNFITSLDDQIMKGTYYRSPEETKDPLRLAISHLNTIAFGCNGLLKWLEPFRYDDIKCYSYMCIYIYIHIIIQYVHVHTQAIALYFMYVNTGYEFV